SISDVDETLFTASIDLNDVLTVIPEFDAWGTDVVTLTLTDSGGKTDSRDIIIAVIGGVGVYSIAGGVYHSYVIYEGVIWGWGYNAWGAVGDGTDEQRESPVPTEIADVISLANGGWGFSLSLKSDGTIWGWGKNSISELGTGVEQNNSLVPVQTLVPASMIIVDSGDNHALALSSDGTVWGWGYNYYGQIGIGSDEPSEVMTPVQIPDFDGVVDIACGGVRSFAVKDDGTVWFWGDGFGYDSPSFDPAHIEGFTDAVAIEGGDNFCIVLKSDGTVWKWGSLMTVPLQYTSLDNVISIAAGYSHVLALKSDGTVWTGSRQVPFLTDVIEIACGYSHSLARKSDGSIWAWGENNYGQIGIGYASLYDQLTPVKVLPIEANTSPVITPVIPDILISFDDTPVTLCLTDYETDVEDGPPSADNDLKWVLWDVDESGVLSASLDLVTETLIITPVPFMSGTGSVTLILADSNGLSDTQEVKVTVLGKRPVAVGKGHNLFVKPGGTVLAWGSGDKGQLGNGVSGTGYDEEAPVPVLNITNIVAVSAGSDHSLALASDGTVWAWGEDTYGQVGDDTVGNIKDVPVNPLGLSGIVSISAGHFHNLALDSDGNVWAWGYNNYGQLGNGTFDSAAYLPFQISGLSNIIAITAGGYHSLALDSDGNIYSWGRGSSGEMGDGTTDNRHTPAITATGLSYIAAIAAGEMSSYALRIDNVSTWNGRVYGWGDNESGELAQGGDDWADKLSPVNVVLAGAKAVAAGGNHTLFIKMDGTLEACGANSYGQLGDGTQESKNYLVPVTGLTDVVAAAAGLYESLALKSDGTLWVWGMSTNLVPVEVVIPNNSPDMPSIPLPANGAVDVYVNMILSWTGGDSDVGDGVSYDVYFGISDPPELVSSGQSGVTYDPGILSDNTTYYWQIVTTDDMGLSTSGPVWSFTTGVAVNTAPVIDSEVANIETPEDIAAPIDLSDNETDVEDGSGDGNGLEWSILGVDETLFIASIDSVTDVLTITSLLNASGSDIVTLVLTDSGGLTATQDVTVTITAVNDAPEIDSPVVDIETPENTSVTRDLSDNETDVEDGSGDGNGLEWSISGVNTELFNASINLATDELTITPVADASGSDVVTLTLTDSGELTDTQDITVTILAEIEINATAVNVLKASEFHSLVLDTVNDIVYCWGYNELGALGTGTLGVPPNSPVPLEVAGLSNVMDV
ncbi:MAG: hypothetical protein KAQ99_04335, partial [Candidatus Aureabacteria bacterium]|nr:hypothetical protein [Candidatus Auribacterota bacterium]